MQITEQVYLVGSGALGFDLTDAFDCHVYLIDCGTELVLIDSGAGMGHASILANIVAHGFPLDRVRTVLLTHAHADHSGGAARLQTELNCAVVAGQRTANLLRSGDEAAISLPAAREAGIYPPEYRFTPCSVERDVQDGEEIVIGKRRFTVVATPGHSADHISFLMYGDQGQQNILFGGDTLFHGGRVLLQYIPDCSIWDYGQSIEKLAQVPFDALLPGHLSLSLHNAHRHVEMARQRLAQLAVPYNVVP